MPARCLNMWPHWPLHSRSCDLHDLRRCHERHEVHTGRFCSVVTRTPVLHTMWIPLHLWVHTCKSVFCHSVMGRSRTRDRGVTTFTVPSHLSLPDIFSYPGYSDQLFYFRAMIFETARKPWSVVKEIVITGSILSVSKWGLTIFQFRNLQR